MIMKGGQQLIHSVTASLLLLISCHGFSYSKKKRTGCFGASSSLLNYSTDDSNRNDDDVAITSFSTLSPKTQQSPEWVPMEIIELAAADLQISPRQFIQNYSDIEAYTSCDDDEDSLHECDFFGQYLGPTKWVHLTPLAQRCGVNRLHFEIWKDVWQNPTSYVEVASAVSKEALRYYNEFMIEEPQSFTECEATRPLVRVKVVPASFGLEGFEDAIWEATEDLLTQCDQGEDMITTTDETKEKCRAVTFVVAAPDLMDPILMEGPKSSPQVEFELDRFQSFASSLSEKLREFSRIEGVPLVDKVGLASFHPLWKKNGEDGGTELVDIDGYFPYPTISVSTYVEVMMR